MTENTIRDRKTGKPFKLTPRRKEILWHIAYDFEVRLKMVPIFGNGRYIRGASDSVPVFHLGHTKIHEIIILLKRAKLVDFDFNAKQPNLRITPLGMQVMLDTVS